MLCAHRRCGSNKNGKKNVLENQDFIKNLFIALSLAEIITEMRGGVDLKVLNGGVVPLSKLR